VKAEFLEALDQHGLSKYISVLGAEGFDLAALAAAGKVVGSPCTDPLLMQVFIEQLRTVGLNMGEYWKMLLLIKNHLAQAK
jgi:hypothetical protein